MVSQGHCSLQVPWLQPMLANACHPRLALATHLKVNSHPDVAASSLAKRDG